MHSQIHNSQFYFKGIPLKMLIIIYIFIHIFIYINTPRASLMPGGRKINCEL